jgi:hypothetical protein
MDTLRFGSFVPYPIIPYFAAFLSLNISVLELTLMDKDFRNVPQLASIISTRSSSLRALSIFAGANAYTDTGERIAHRRSQFGGGGIGAFWSTLTALSIIQLSTFRTLRQLSLEVDLNFNSQSLRLDAFTALESLGIRGPAEACRAFIDVIASRQLTSLHLERTNEDSDIRELFPIVNRKWPSTISSLVIIDDVPDKVFLNSLFGWELYPIHDCHNLRRFVIGGTILLSASRAEVSSMKRAWPYIDQHALQNQWGIVDD